MSEKLPTINASSIAQVVNAGLCIGCGLCESLTKRQVTMQMTPEGTLRPAPIDGFDVADETLLLSVCPGIHIRPRQQSDLPVNANTSTKAACPPNYAMDDIWGEYASMQYAWAADPEVRYKGSTGGVLNALGRHLLNSHQAAFIYQVKADPQAPIRSIATMSETAEDLMNDTASRYGPVAPLTGLLQALDRNEPFAVIAKPCDLSAIHNYAAHDERVNKLISHRLVMVCGGQSTEQKARDLLHASNIKPQNVTLYRHRGYGNPGPTRVESNDGKIVEISYQELWKDESSWGIESRCKLCPDALGEASDIAAADVWPGGSPVGEDEGFNGIVVRTDTGSNLVASAVDAGELVLGEKISVEQFNDFQPHQVNKKIALQARYQGLADVGAPQIHAPESRLEILGKRLNSDEAENERAGTARRFK